MADGAGQIAPDAYPEVSEPLLPVEPAPVDGAGVQEGMIEEIGRFADLLEIFDIGRARNRDDAL